MSPQSDDDDSVEYVDLVEVFTMDDYLAHQTNFNNVVSQVALNMQHLFQPSTSNAPCASRTYIRRDCEAHHAMIWNDYFSNNPVFIQQQF